MAEDTINTTITPEPVIAAPSGPQTVIAPVAQEVSPALEVAPEIIVAPVETKETLLTSVAEVPEPKVQSTPEGGQSENPAPPLHEGEQAVQTQVIPEVVLPKYDSFTIPEDVQLDSSRIGKFTDLLTKLETDGKASHEVVQAFGQEAVNFYINEMKEVSENVANQFKAQREGERQAWKEASLKDPMIGGNRIEGTISSIKNLVRTHGGTADQQKEFYQVMETTGLGDNPVILRFLSGLAQSKREGVPLAAAKPVQEAKSRTETLYGKK